METPELIELQGAIKAALSSSRALDRCHAAYATRRRVEGLSRARATTYQAKSGDLASFKKSDVKSLKELARNVMGFDNEIEGLQRVIEGLKLEIAALKVSRSGRPNEIQ